MQGQGIVHEVGLTSSLFDLPVLHEQMEEDVSLGPIEVRRKQNLDLI
jgi:hypothetical protein